MEQPKKIIYLISHAGGGHRTAADALETAIKELRGADAYEHKIIDIWSLGGKRGQFLGNKFYDFIVKQAPYAYALGYWAGNNPVLFNYISQQICNEVCDGMKNLIKSEKPDAIVSVHPLANHPVFHSLSELKLIGKIKTANIVIELITLHRAWLNSKEFDLITVPTREAKEQFLLHGYPEERIKLIGPVVRPQFFGDYGSIKDIRTKEGLDADKFMVLIMGGAEGCGKIMQIVKELDKIDKKIQMVVLASKNKELIAELEGQRFRSKVKIIGFTARLPQLMRAADMIITKAGSITISEALACGLPMIIDSYIPGQESGNPPWIERNGFGKYIKDPKQIAITVGEWIGSDKLKKFKENIRSFFPPRSTFRIAEEILKLLD